MMYNDIAATCVWERQMERVLWAKLSWYMKIKTKTGVKPVNFEYHS